MSGLSTLCKLSRQGRLNPFQTRHFGSASRLLAKEPGVGWTAEDGDEHVSGKVRRHRPTPKNVKQFRSVLTSNKIYKVSKEVADAMRSNKPLVALETAIYTHGFPKPDNFELAKEMEQTVRDNGAVPVTIALMNGKVMVGLEPDELEELAESAGTDKVAKISRRDIAYRIGQQGPPLFGGTTIAGTMAIVANVGIKVFATGGLGGVHRGGESSFDISADLHELGKSNVAVISSGMKSFLDIGRTLEYLETQGVFVSTFGNRGDKIDVPGFFSRESGYRSPNVVHDVNEAAHIITRSHMLYLKSGSLFFNPIPAEFEIPKSEMDPIVAAAVEKHSSVAGKDNTPAVLNEILQMTEGRSKVANRHLVLNNAKVGAQLAARVLELERTGLKGLMKVYSSRPTSSAVSLPRNPRGENVSPTDVPGNRRGFKSWTRPEDSPPQSPSKSTPEKEAQETSTEPDISVLPWGEIRISKTVRNAIETEASTESQSTLSSGPSSTSPERISSEEKDNSPSSPKQSTPTPEHRKLDILVAGGIVVDRIATLPPSSQKHVSTPGKIETSIGGVAKNVAITIHNLAIGAKVELYSLVGEDADGDMVHRQLKLLGFDPWQVNQVPGMRTAQYMAMNSSDVEGGLSMAVADMEIHKGIGHTRIVRAIGELGPKIVCIDGNLTFTTAHEICKAAVARGAIVAIEPTSAAKATQIADLIIARQSSFPFNLINIITPNSYELEAIHSSLEARLRRGKEDAQDSHLQPLLIKLENEETASIPLYIKAYHQSDLDFLLREITSFPRSPTEEELTTYITQSLELISFTDFIILKLGEKGVLIIRLVRSPSTQENKSTPSSSFPNKGELYIKLQTKSKSDLAGLHIAYYPAEEVIGTIINSNGAGDTFLGTFLQGVIDLPPVPEKEIAKDPCKYFNGKPLKTLVGRGQSFAGRCLTRNESHGVRLLADQYHPTLKRDVRIWGQKKLSLAAQLRRMKQLVLLGKVDILQVTKRGKVGAEGLGLGEGEEDISGQDGGAGARS